MTADALLARVVRLERRARRDRAFALGALAVFLATAQAPVSGPLAVTAASGASARLTAGGLRVADAAGTSRVAVWIDDGAPSFDESDAAGKLRQSAFLAEGLPVLRQYDARGKERNAVYMAKNTLNTVYTITDENNVQRLNVFRGSNGNPEIALYGTDGQARTYLETDDDVPFLVMRDRGGHTRVAMGAYTSGRIGMDVRDAAGTTLWKTP